jgi:hypothetical protein
MEKKMKEFTLVGVDGNVFSVIGYTANAMKEVGFSRSEIDNFRLNMTSKTSYDAVLCDCIAKIDECNHILEEKKRKEKDEKKAQTEKQITRTQEEVDSYIESLFDKLVPASGKADTVAGEIIRAICRITYRWFNDGDYAGYGYGMETAGSACTYLTGFDGIENHVYTLLDIVDDDDAYEKALLVLSNAIIDYLETHKELFDEANDEDYQDCDEWCGDSDEKFEREHWGEDYDDEYEDDWDDEDDDDDDNEWDYDDE